MANYVISTEEITTRKGKANAVNIKFEGKPTEEIRNILKEHRFRWYAPKGIWYGFSKVEDITKALGDSVAYEEPKEVKKATTDKPASKKGTEVKAYFAALDTYVTVTGTLIDTYDVVAVKVGDGYRAIDVKSGVILNTKEKPDTLKALKALLEEKEADINAFRMSDKYKKMVA